jgi:antitoxin (DNA-binding transcriptional repressor) of toxin-antitoxin stability system
MQTKEIMTMALYNVHQAKTQLSKLLQFAEQGKEVIIARDGKPIARLSAFSKALPAPRVFGQFNGIVSSAEIDALFSAEADAEILGLFETSASKPILPSPSPMSASKWK